MARRVLAWECRYCGALKKTENICLRHEKSCLKNPEPKNCILCKYSQVTATDDSMLFTKTNKSLSCQKGKTCSQATSANCEYYALREELKNGSD